ANRSVARAIVTSRSPPHLGVDNQTLILCDAGEPPANWQRRIRAYRIILNNGRQAQRRLRKLQTDITPTRNEEKSLRPVQPNREIYIGIIPIRAACIWMNITSRNIDLSCFRWQLETDKCADATLTVSFVAEERSLRPHQDLVGGAIAIFRVQRTGGEWRRERSHCINNRFIGELGRVIGHGFDTELRTTHRCSGIGIEMRFRRSTEIAAEP